ncbi:MAG TPA: hypothetical protein VIR65_14850 [Rhizorhapis sp.]
MMADQNDILAGNKAENSFCPDTDLRLRFLACRRRNGWSLAQISRGMHVVRSFDHVSVATLERFARGACSLGREHARPVSTFIADWPEPGPFEEWRVTLAREAVQRKVAELADIGARIAANEARRRAYVEACLAAEKPRLRLRTPSGVLPPREARHG